MKLVQEVTTIVESKTLKVAGKIAALNAIQTERRPGREEAEKIRDLELARIEQKRRLLQGSKSSRKGFYYKSGVTLGGSVVKTLCHDNIINGWQKPTAEVLWKIRFELHLKSLRGDILTSAIEHEIGCGLHDFAKKYNCTPREAANQYRALFASAAARLNAEKTRRDAEIAAFKAETGLGEAFLGKQQPIEVVQSNKAVSAYKAAKMYAKAGAYYLVVDQNETEDWEKYSKSWHNQHGPYREITRRYVRVYTGGAEMAQLDVASFAGNYLLNAVAEYLKITPVKVAKELKPVQLNPMFGVEKLHQIGGAAIYRRTFGGETVDYCAVSADTTFHALTTAAAVAGLKTKLAAAAKAEAQRLENENRTLTAEYCQEVYNFCHTGIQRFCALNNLNADGTYTVREIRAAVLQNRSENCSWFRTELKIIGIVLNCK